MLFRNTISGNIVSAADETTRALMEKSPIYETVVVPHQPEPDPDPDSVTDPNLSQPPAPGSEPDNEPEKKPEKAEKKPAKSKGTQQ